MNKEFVSYEQAVALKELGFDEPCLARFFKVGDEKEIFIYFNTPSNENTDVTIIAPLKSQVFEWFREKHDLIYSIGYMGHSNTWAYEIINISMPGPNYGYAQTYEEAEQACLDELIKIVKNGNTRN